MSAAIPSHSIEIFGAEEEPVVVIDHFSGCADALLAGAQGAPFVPAGVGYPGIRAPSPRQFVAEKASVLTAMARDVFGYVGQIRCDPPQYSIVTTVPSDLKAAQRQPHYDGTNEDLLAVLLYLNGPETGGTGFFAHRQSGFETITPDRAEGYAALLKEEHAALGEPDQEYVCGDNKQFSLIGAVDAQPDRLIMYRGRRLHSGLIPRGAPLSPDPVVGRVTVNMFLTEGTVA